MKKVFTKTLVLPLLMLLCVSSNEDYSFFRQNANDNHSLSELFTLDNFSLKNEHKEINSVFTNYKVGYGVEFSGGGNGSVTYKNIVDLKQINKTDNLVEFIANSSLDYSDLNKTSIEIKNMKIKVSDAYDSNIYFEVNVRQNETINQVPIESFHGGLNNVFYSVTFNGYTVANNSDYTPLTNTCVAWKQSLFNTPTYLNGSTGDYLPTGFKYDLENNQILLDIGNAASPSTKDPHNHLLFDLDDPTDAYPDFKGFTTGEVIISFSSTEIGDFTIAKIGNDTFINNDLTLYQKNTGNLLTYNYDFNNMIRGAKNSFYPLPKIKTNTSYEAKIENDDGEVTFSSLDNFIPTKMGNYKITLTSLNAFNYKMEVVGLFVINEEPTPIESETLLNKIKATIFEPFTIPTINVSGGNGKLTKHLKIYLDDYHIYDVNEGDTFIIEDKYQSPYISLQVTDEIKTLYSAKYEIELNTNVKRFFINDSFKENYVSHGQDFTVPNFTAIDYSKDDVSKNNFKVNIKRGKNTYYQPGDVIENVTSDFELNYMASNELLETVKVFVTDNEISSQNDTDLSKFYKNSTNIKQSKISDIGVLFNIDGDTAVINQPMNVSTTDLTISFCYMPDKAHYDNVDIYFSAIGGNEIKLSLKELGEKPLLYLNNERIYKSISVSSLNYSTQDEFGLNGKKYFKYTFVLSSENKVIYNANNQFVVSLDKYLNGSSFTGFKFATTKIRFEINNSNKDDLFFINQISNQILTTKVLKYGDTKPSYIAFTSPLSSGMFTKNSVVTIPNAYCYDVINSSNYIYLNVVSPDGDYILKNADPKSFNLVLKSYGVYVVTYFTSDGNNQKGNFSYRLVVNDDVGPEIITNANYKDSYKNKVYIYKAKAIDNIDGEVNVIAILNGPDGNSYVVNMGEYASLSLKGKYSITYYAIDEAGNASTLVYEFISK